MKRRNGHDHVDPKSFRADEAGRYLLTNVPTASPHESVLALKRRLCRRGAKWDTVNYVYVLDEASRIVGVASIREVLEASPAKKMSVFFVEQLVSARPHSKLAIVTGRAIAGNIKAIPVTDDNGAFLGVVGTDAILAELDHMHVRDVLTASGVVTTASIRELFVAKVSDLVKWRIPWLLFGLIGGILLASIVGAFGAVIEEVVELAFFIPVMAYMGAAVGAQSQMLYMKGMTFGLVKYHTYVLRELVVNTIIALVSAPFVGVFALILTRSIDVSLAVVLALFCIMSTAGFVSVTVTHGLRRFTKDPAFSGGPISAVIQDTISLLVYFIITGFVVL